MVIKKNKEVKMKYKEILNSYIIKEILKALIVVLIIVIMAIKISTYFFRNNFNTVYTANNLIIDLQPNIKKSLNKISDYESLTMRGNIVNVTNNGEYSKYKMLVCGKKSKDLRLNISNNNIKNLNDYVYENGCYTILEEDIDSNRMNTYELKLFLAKSSKVSDIIVNYKIKIVSSENK